MGYLMLILSIKLINLWEWRLLSVNIIQIAIKDY